jgi:hypothetical protein
VRNDGILVTAVQFHHAIVAGTAFQGLGQKIAGAGKEGHGGGLCGKIVIGRCVRIEVDNAIQRSHEELNSSAS